jgi:hypothetical protein
MYRGKCAFILEKDSQQAVPVRGQKQDWDTVIHREIDLVKELLDMEPDSKCMYLI